MKYKIYNNPIPGSERITVTFFEKGADLKSLIAVLEMIDELE